MPPVSPTPSPTLPPARACVVVPAGGRGSRMGGNTPKQFLTLAGTPILVATLRALHTCADVVAVVVVAPADECDRTAALMVESKVPHLIGPITGGDSRQASVHAGLRHIPTGIPVVAVHDAARPFVDPETLSIAIARAATGVGVVVGCPARDTIKRVDENGRIQGTPDRATLWQAFTPQVFPTDLLVAAYATAQQESFVGTDDASLVERLGHPVEMLEGGRESLKITTPQDLVTAESWCHGAGGHPLNTTR